MSDNDEYFSIEATHHTTRGKRLQVIAETTLDGVTGWRWRCTGCQTMEEFAARFDRALALSSAQEHARTCRTV